MHSVAFKIVILSRSKYTCELRKLNDYKFKVVVQAYRLEVPTDKSNLCNNCLCFEEEKKLILSTKLCSSGLSNLYNGIRLIC